MDPTTQLTIERLDAGGVERRLPELAEVLHACVLDGASVGFILPFTLSEAGAFWRDVVAPPLAAGGRTLFVAICGGRLVGTAQLLHDMPANQPHRGEVAKVLVRPDARRRGAARALVARVETEARARGLGLLTLDTRSIDPALALYRGCGFAVAGEIPHWCRDTASPRLDATTFMYKIL